MFYLISQIAGIFVGRFFSLDIKICLIFVLLNFACLILAEKNYKKIFLCTLIFSLFISFVNFKNIKINDFNGTVSGVVTESKSDYFILKTNKIGTKKFKTKIKLYGHAKLGENLKIRGKFYAPEEKLNEGGFNSRINYMARGVYLIGKINDLEVIKEPKFFYKMLNQFKKSREKIFDKYLNDKNSKLIKSIIFSEKSLIDNNTRENFNELGINHILAVSGLHILILSIFIEKVSLKLFSSKRISDFATLLILFMYLLLIAFPVGGFRAYLFLLISKMRFYFKMPIRKIDALYITIFIILSINPFNLYSISFLLSFGAVFGIFFIYPRLKNKSKILNSFYLSFSIYVMIFPIINYYFSGIGIVSFLANGIVIPIFSFIIILSFLMMFLFPAIFGIIINFLLNAIYGIFILLLQFNFFNLEIYGTNEFIIFIYYLVIVLIYNRYKLEDFYRFKDLIYCYFVYFLIITSLLFYKDYNSLKINYIYTGQADTTHISYRNKNYLIDVGGSIEDENNNAEKYIMPYLKYNGINKIDKIFITHFDEDHYGNLDKLYDKFKINDIYISYVPEKDIIYKMKKYTKVHLIKKGDYLRDNKLSIKVLSESAPYRESNDNSLILILSYEDNKFFFGGDISSEIEDNINEKINVLKVSHHGSSSSTSSKFLKNTKPEIAVISAGIRNPYSHPKKDVLDRLDEENIKYFLTARDGRIKIIVNNGLQIKKFLDEKIEVNIIYDMILILIFVYVELRKYELQKNISRKIS